ncbi:MAG: hypothetical protein JOZ24_03195, partial [Candidatus Eremiobacteraeota bacterium]|nr:hypothetical protein [Candidatus Eremiobacteraeota bacterium]
AQGSVNTLRDVLFSIDSGGAGVGFAPALQAIGAAHIRTFPDKARLVMGGGGEVRAIPTVTQRVCLGSACQTDVEGAYVPGGDSLFPFKFAGTISDAFLKRYAVTLDFVRMRMLLSAQRPPDAPSPC